MVFLSHSSTPSRTTIVCAVALVLPFSVVNPGGFQPFQSQVQVLLPLAVVVGLVLRTGRVADAPLNSRVAAATLLFLFCSSLSTVVSGSPSIGLLGDSGRMTGLVSLLLMAATGWCGVLLAHERHGFVVVRRTIMVAGLVMAMGSLAMKMGVAIPAYPALGPSGRLLGPMGSATQLGAAMLLALACAVSLALDPAELRIWRRSSVFASALFMVVLVLSGARAAWLGVAIGVVLVFFHPGLRTTMSKVRPRLVLCGVLVATLTLIVAVPLTRTRLVSMFNLSRGTVGGRVDIWRAALPAVGDRWFLGWGLDQARGPIMRHLAVGFETTYGSVETVDRAHSVVLDQLLWTGVLGLVALLVLVVVWWKEAGRANPSTNRAVLRIGLVAFGVHLLFNFPAPEIDALAWLIAGLLLGDVSMRERVVPAKVVRGFHVVTAVGMVGVLIIGLGNYIADHRLQRAVSSENVGHTEEALASYAGARSVGAMLPLYRESYARALMRLGSPAAAVRAAEDATRNFRSDPMLQELTLRARTQAAFAVNDTRTGGLLVGDYEDLCIRYPSRVSFQMGLALAYLTSGNVDAARNEATAASHRAPLDPAPEYVLALIEDTAGNAAEADAHRREAARREAR